MERVKDKVLKFDGQSHNDKSMNVAAKFTSPKLQDSTKDTLIVKEEPRKQEVLLNEIEEETKKLARIDSLKKKITDLENQLPIKKQALEDIHVNVIKLTNALKENNDCQEKEKNEINLIENEYNKFKEKLLQAKFNLLNEIGNENEIIKESIDYIYKTYKAEDKNVPKDNLEYNIFIYNQFVSPFVVSFKDDWKLIDLDLFFKNI